MNDDLEKWLNEGLKESVEAAAQADAAPTQPVAPQTNGEVKKTPSLAKQGINVKGGVIRNPNTKRRTQLNNPLTNPRRPSKNVPTEEEDKRAELIGQHPGLAIPSIMTGMDSDTRKEPEQPTEVQQAAGEAPMAPAQLSYDTTLRELLQRALRAGGTMHWGNSRFVISIQVSASSG